MRTEVRPRASNSLRMYGSTAAWTAGSMWQPSWVPVAVHQVEAGSLKGSTVAKFTPLWHGVDLTRMLVLDQVRPGAAVMHLTVLVLLSVAGAALATWRLVRRMAQ